MPLEDFLQPRQIDWRLNATERRKTQDSRVHEWLSHLNDAPAPFFNLHVAGNAPYHSHFPGSHNFTTPYFSEAWHFLFQPAKSFKREVRVKEHHYLMTDLT